jgi:hypothetical protein
MSLELEIRALKFIQEVPPMFACICQTVTNAEIYPVTVGTLYIDIPMKITVWTKSCSEIISLPFMKSKIMISCVFLF